MSKADSNARVEYRSIEGYPGYCVGSDGTVWTNRIKTQVPKNGSVITFGEWRECRYYPARNKSYLEVRLSRSGKKSAYCIAVHTLVMLTFNGPRPAGKLCRHLNDIKTDNQLSNLAWGTHKNNAEDRIRNGRQQRGSAAGNAKLNENIVADIRRRARNGETIISLATELSLSKSTIADAITGRSYAHVNEPPVVGLKKIAWKQIARASNGSFARQVDRA